MEITLLVNLGRIGAPERDHRPDGDDLDRFAVAIQNTKVQAQMSAEVVRLLEDVGADLGWQVGGTRAWRYTDVLFPELRSFDHVEGSGPAVDFIFPVLDADGSSNGISPFVAEGEIGSQIYSLGRSL